MVLKNIEYIAKLSILFERSLWVSQPVVFKVRILEENSEMAFPIPQKSTKVLTIQPTEDVTVVLTGHNEVIDELSGVYMTTVELPDVGVFENQSPQKLTKVLTIQLTDDVTVVLTGHNEINDKPSNVYTTTDQFPKVKFFEIQFPEVKFSEFKFPEIHFTVFEKIREFFETIVKFITEIQLPEIKFPEIEFPEVKFPEIQFPSLEPIFEKIREFFGAIVKFITEYFIIIIVVVIIIIISLLSPQIFLGFLYLLGFGAKGIIGGSLVAIAQSISALGICGACGAKILSMIGFGTLGILRGGLVAICQSIAAIGAGGLQLLPVVVMAVLFMILFFYAWASAK
ncbi:14264_t:CDS:2 [Dentiscutata erythropus]|uniref:14264_t:CDS:1 n=1 Tax=Dentiscutata erythropus TaxID=1348616 RepID=A0A9N8ZB96_9GLOM|nr:14264_t:CDS:2 [Dentiscutata erythropus]